MSNLVEKYGFANAKDELVRPQGSKHNLPLKPLNMKPVEFFTPNGYNLLEDSVKSKTPRDVINSNFFDNLYYEKTDKSLFTDSIPTVTAGQNNIFSPYTPIQRSKSKLMSYARIIPMQYPTYNLRFLTDVYNTVHYTSEGAALPESAYTQVTNDLNTLKAHMFKAILPISLEYTYEQDDPRYMALIKSAMLDQVEREISKSAFASSVTYTGVRDSLYGQFDGYIAQSVTNTYDALNNSLTKDLLDDVVDGYPDIYSDVRENCVFIMAQQLYDTAKKFYDDKDTPLYDYTRTTGYVPDHYGRPIIKDHGIPVDATTGISTVLFTPLDNMAVGIHTNTAARVYFDEFNMQYYIIVSGMVGFKYIFEPYVSKIYNVKA